ARSSRPALDTRCTSGPVRGQPWRQGTPMHEPLCEPYRALALFPEWAPGTTPPAATIVRRVRPLATFLSPVARRLVYPGGSTRLPTEETDLELRVDGVALRGWEVNPGRDRALVYYGGNGEGLDWLVPVIGRLLPDHTSYLIAYRG